MKNLKLILSVLVLAMGAISFVNAENYCLEIPGSPSYGLCGDGEFCQSDSCSCPSLGTILSGDKCTTEMPIMCPFGNDYLHVDQTGLVYQSSTVIYPDTCVSGVVACNSSGNLIGSTFTATSCDQIPDFSGCSLPWGGTIASGASITGFPLSSVPCNQSCGIQTTATCLGNNNWSGNENNARYPACIPNICVGGGGGGGSSTPTCTFVDLMCVSGTYQKKPGVNCINGNLGNACSGTGILITTGNVATGAGLDPIDYTKIGDISNSPYSQELNLAYLYAYNMGITTMPNIFKADLEGKLIRSHMAKMMVEFAALFDRKINTGANCSFTDMRKQSDEMKYYSTLACQLGLMGLDDNGNPAEKFNPSDTVTRAQFGTVLSRLLYGNLYNTQKKNQWYVQHLEALNSVEIMKKISQPWDYELRGWVMLMLHRAHTKLVK